MNSVEKQDLTDLINNRLKELENKFRIDCENRTNFQSDTKNKFYEEAIQKTLTRINEVKLLQNKFKEYLR